MSHASLRQLPLLTAFPALTGCPKMFFLPAADHSSTYSAIVDDGVIRHIAATSLNIYAICAAADYHRRLNNLLFCHNYMILLLLDFKCSYFDIPKISTPKLRKKLKQQT